MPNFRILIVAAATIVLLPNFSFAQGVADYPTKPVRVIVSTAPGGGNDLQARIFAQKLNESLKRPFVVENHGGGGGSIGIGLVAKSTPDGYTLLSVAPNLTFAPALNPNFLYDPVKDFAPISMVATSPFLLLVSPELSVKSVNELIALARSKPGTLNIGVTNGSITHLAAAWFTSMANVKGTFIPYKGSGDIIIGALSSQVNMFFGSVTTTLSHVKSGRLRALAISGAERSSAVPELPTIAESGLPGYNVTTWYGWLASAGTPAGIVTKLSAEIAKAAKSSDVAKKLADDGGEAVGSTPEQFQQLITEETLRWRKVVKDSGIRME